MLDSYSKIDSSWHDIIATALATMDQDYLKSLAHSSWLPGQDNIFNAFSLPVSHTHYLLLGESPYPRAQSANGYAFWDAAVEQLWSPHGLSAAVNRATSLRNFIKMLLHAAGYLAHDFSQGAIATLDKSAWVQTGDELFHNIVKQGFLLLNASLVLSNTPVPIEARQWQPFMASLLEQLSYIKPSLKLILFGKIATRINKLCPANFEKLVAEHPYNLSFITNREVIAFFKPLNLLAKSG